MTKKITLEPEEIAVLEEAIEDKRKDFNCEISWRRLQEDMQKQESLIEKADTLDRIKKKLK